MRNLRPGDKLIRREDGGWYIESCHGGCIVVEPVVHSNLSDFARWWIRQSELREDVTLGRENKMVLQQIIDQPK